MSNPMERLAMCSTDSLESFCERVGRSIQLSEFNFDAENETEWGEAMADGYRFNISKPYEEGTLQEWNSSVPKGCNFGITLISNNNQVIGEDIVNVIGQKLSEEFSTDVFYHESWRGVEDRISRDEVYSPAQA